MAGKGDKRRPAQISEAEFGVRWNAIFQPRQPHNPDCVALYCDGRCGRVGPCYVDTSKLVANAQLEGSNVNE